jgi:6-phosphofructokinase 1
VASLVKRKEEAETNAEKKQASEELERFHEHHVDHTLRLTHELEQRTGMESRLTILGHLQRGGTPSAADRLLATRLGTSCAELLNDRVYGVMVAARGDGVEPVPLEKVAGKKNLVPPDHPWVHSAKLVGTCLGD